MIKRLLLMLSCVAFGVAITVAGWPRAPGVDLDLQLHGGALFVNGVEAHGHSWLANWEETLDALAQRDAAMGAKTRLRIHMDAQLAFPIFEMVLAAAEDRGFDRYEFDCGDGAPVSFVLPGRKIDARDGVYKRLILTLGADGDWIDQAWRDRWNERLRDAILSVRIQIDPDVAMGQVVSLIRPALARTPSHILEVRPSEYGRSGFIGSVANHATISSAEVQVDAGREYLLIPKEILDKAESGEPFR